MPPRGGGGGDGGHGGRPNERRRNGGRDVTVRRALSETQFKWIMDIYGPRVFGGYSYIIHRKKRLAADRGFLRRRRGRFSRRTRRRRRRRNNESDAGRA